MATDSIDNGDYGTVRRRQTATTWRLADSDNLKKATGLLTGLLIVGVLGLLLGVVGLIGAHNEADKTHKQLDDIQRAVVANPGNPVAPTPKPEK